MIDLFLLDSRLAGATESGVGGTFQSSTNRQCQLHQSSRFLVERSRLMTAVSQIVKSLPHGWIQLPDFFNWFRQFPRHSGTPCYGIVFGNIPPLEGTLPSPILVYSRLCQSLYCSLEPGLSPNSGPSSTHNSRPLTVQPEAAKKGGDAWWIASSRSWSRKGLVRNSTAPDFMAFTDIGISPCPVMKMTGIRMPASVNSR